MEYKSRKDMDPRFQWDMYHIFADTAAWEAAYAKAEALVAELPALEGTLGASAESLKNGLDRLYAAAQAVELVYAYASLCKSGDNGDPQNQNMEGKAVNLYVTFSTAVSFFDPEGNGTSIVTHEVIEILEDGSFRTKGTNNNTADDLPVPVENLVGVMRKTTVLQKTKT